MVQSDNRSVSALHHKPPEIILYTTQILDDRIRQGLSCISPFVDAANFHTKASFIKYAEQCHCVYLITYRKLYYFKTIFFHSLSLAMLFNTCCFCSVYENDPPKPSQDQIFSLMVWRFSNQISLTHARTESLNKS